MLSSGNKEFTMSSNVNSPVSPDAHCASSISDLRETHSHSDVSFGSPLGHLGNFNIGTFLLDR